jgi:hypothetical protein
MQAQQDAAVTSVLDIGRIGPPPARVTRSFA